MKKKQLYTIKIAYFPESYAKQVIFQRMLAVVLNTLQNAMKSGSEKNTIAVSGNGLEVAVPLMRELNKKAKK